MYKYQEINNKYRREKLDRMEIFVPKGKREEIKNYAKKNYPSLNAYVVSLIYKDMGIDQEEKK